MPSRRLGATAEVDSRSKHEAKVSDFPKGRERSSFEGSRVDCICVLTDVGARSYVRRRRVMRGMVVVSRSSSLLVRMAVSRIVTSRLTLVFGSGLGKNENRLPF